MTPSRDGEGGHPGAGGLWLNRSSLGPGEGAASLGGSAWGRRACWVPLAKSQEVSDPRRKTPVLPYPASTTANGREAARSLRPRRRDASALTSRGPGNPGQPEVSAPPTPERGSSPTARDWEPSFCRARVASSHPEIMRAWRALSTAGGGDRGTAPHSSEAGGAGGAALATAGARDQVWKRVGPALPRRGRPPPPPGTCPQRGPRWPAARAPAGVTPGAEWGPRAVGLAAAR